MKHQAPRPDSLVVHALGEAAEGLSGSLDCILSVEETKLYQSTLLRPKCRQTETDLQVGERFQKDSFPASREQRGR